MLHPELNNLSQCFRPYEILSGSAHQSFAEQFQIPEPLLNLWLDRADVTGAGDGGDIDVAVVQILLDVVGTTQNKHILGVLVG